VLLSSSRCIRGKNVTGTTLKLYEFTANRLRWTTFQESRNGPCAASLGVYSKQLQFSTIPVEVQLRRQSSDLCGGFLSVCDPGSLCTCRGPTNPCWLLWFCGSPSECYESLLDLRVINTSVIRTATPRRGSRDTANLHRGECAVTRITESARSKQSRHWIFGG